MNKDQILGILRHLLTYAGGTLVTSGLGTQDQATAIVGGVVALAGIVWSVLQKKKA